MIYIGNNKYKLYVGSTPMKIPEDKNWYITNGLICHLDGIDNVARGVHDSNAATWIDLTGNGYDVPVAAFIGDQINGWDSDALDAKDVHNVPFSKPCSNYVTIEIGFLYSGYQCLFNSGDGLYKMVAVRNNGTMQFYNISNQSFVFTSNNGKIFATGVHSPNVDAPLNYSNGVLISPTLSDTWAGNSFPTCLGRGNNTGGGYAFTGKYYYIRLYNRALTAEEIAHNFDIDKKRFNILPYDAQVEYLQGTVSRQLFGNAGTSSFGLGPDKN